MKILFLDMDGAGANSNKLIYGWFGEKTQQGYSTTQAKEEYCKVFCGGLELIFPEKAKLVKKIIDETGAKIVWSTDWRKYPPYLRNIEAAKQMLNRYNMCGDSLIGYTPDMGGYADRGDEIREYLCVAKKKGENIEKSAVLDDRTDAGYNLPEGCVFFKTNINDGITEEIAQKIIDYFND